MKPTEREEIDARIKELVWGIRGHLFVVIALLGLVSDDITMHPYYLPFTIVMCSIAFICYMKSVSVWHNANKWRIGK